MAAIETGSILEGTVSGITKFGAFITLEEGKNGLVHISEIANSYVSDVNEHLTVGQKVKVRVLNVSEDGKINLSIKRAAAPAAPAAKRPQQSFRQPKPARQAERVAADPPSADQEFEDRLKKFMQESDSRIADNKMYQDHKQRSRRR